MIAHKSPSQSAYKHGEKTKSRYVCYIKTRHGAVLPVYTTATSSTNALQQIKAQNRECKIQSDVILARDVTDVTLQHLLSSRKKTKSSPMQGGSYVAITPLALGLVVVTMVICFTAVVACYP